MKLRNYVSIMHTDSYIKIYRQNQKNLIIEGKLDALDLDAYLDKEVSLASGSADRQGVVFIIE